MSKYKCSKDLYCSFLSVTSQRYSALSLSQVSPNDLSHDAVSRWLSDTHCQPKQIWLAAKNVVLSSQSGVIVADESVIDKSRSDKVDLVRWQYSGNRHGVIKGIGVLNFLWVNGKDVCPIDFRIWEPQEDGKTKNDHFRDQIKAAKERGINPEAVLADSWYSSLDNLKCIRSMGWEWVMGLKKNRIVNRGDVLEKLTIPEDGLEVHLRGYGIIKVFRFVAKNGRTDYLGTSRLTVTRDKMKVYWQERWQIEVYHRELKQTCGFEHCQARTSRAQRNHITLSILSWIKQANARRRFHLTFYQQQWETIKTAIAEALLYELSIT